MDWEAGMLVGYVRVSKADGSQVTDLQRDALLAAGVMARHLYEDTASGKRDDRPGLAACLKALTLSREQAREHSMRFTWKESARQFLENIERSRSDVKLTITPSPGMVRAAHPVKNG